MSEPNLNLSDLDDLLQTLDELVEVADSRVVVPDCKIAASALSDGELEHLLLEVQADTTAAAASSFTELGSSAQDVLKRAAQELGDLSDPPLPSPAMPAAMAGALGLGLGLDSSFDFDSPVSRPPSAMPVDNNENSSNGRSFRIAGGSAAMTLVPVAAANERLRCARVMLGGPSVPRGHKPTSFSRNACDSLLCLKCNFPVAAFSGHRWSPLCDYLYIRTHRSPEVDAANTKLRQMLEERATSCAYCCQCAFVSIEDGEEREMRGFAVAGEAGGGGGEAPSWCCGGHVAAVATVASAAPT